MKIELSTRVEWDGCAIGWSMPTAQHCRFCLPQPAKRTPLWATHSSSGVDRIHSSRYEDTNKLFVPPKHFNLRVTAEGTAHHMIGSMMTTVEYKPSRGN